MIHYSESITGDHHESEDIVMKVFNSIWMSTVKLDSPEGFRYYMVNCIKNASLNYLKSRRRLLRKAQSHEELELEDDQHYYEAYSEYKAMVYKRIDGLKDNHKEILLLTALGYSNKEISTRFSTTLNSIQVIKHKLINGLRKEFKRPK